MTSIELLTPQRIVFSLQSKCCPACGGSKKEMQTLCLHDYRRLPVELRNALYQRLGNGYREAVHEALRFLDVTEFIDPPEEAH